MEEVVNTYAKAIETIQPSKSNGKLHKLWINYAKFYETHNDLGTARIIMDKATKVSFKSVSELAKVWIAWAEMELLHDNFDQAVKVMEMATKGPKRSIIDYFDETKSPQERLHKSMEVWSFYIDLVESVGDLSEVKPLYDRVFELKIGTMATVVNYASLLEENGYFEEAFKVYERGVDLFSYPAAFEIWNIYLRKAVDRKLGVERLRDLFEQALEGCPARMCKAIFIMYGKLEEERGLVSNALKIYDRATRAVDDASRLEMYRYYISQVVDNFGLPASRRIFQQAIDNLKDEDANAIAQEFIQVEEKLGEIDRARVLYGFSSQFNDPNTHPDFWERWQRFEVEFGSEETYKEMLRIKRSIKRQFENDSRTLAVETVSANEPNETVSNAMDELQKEAAAPVGFVLGSQQPKSDSTGTKAAPVASPAVNPDEIEIDM
jgi:pre-mRNA-splicing factor SYF1